MATLASAGSASLAYEHEVGKQFRRLERISRELKRKAKEDPDLQPLSEELQDWLKQAKRSRSLFSPILDEEKREAAKALSADQTIKQIVHDLDLILEGVSVSMDVDPDLRLPKARYAEWSAILQNAFSNAAAALGQATSPEIRIRGGTSGRNRYIRVEDNGAGIDLAEAERLFEPFERGNPAEVGPGTGLGLAIVKMLADSIGVRVAFVEPAEGMSTSLRISWRPKKS
jgi:signal transduction histidine kinase